MGPPEDQLPKRGFVKGSPLDENPLRLAACRLAAYNGWPVLHLAEDIVVADRGPWSGFLRQATDDEVLYAFRVLRARTRLIDASHPIRALLDVEVA